MGHVTAPEIQAALDTGKKVWSRAVGRWGRIIRVDGKAIELRAGRKGTGQVCITWFHDGDPVKLIERDGEFYVMPDGRD
jgi:hypothetical protein